MPTEYTEAAEDVSRRSVQFSAWGGHVNEVNVQSSKEEGGENQ